MRWSLLLCGVVGLTVGCHFQAAGWEPWLVSVWYTDTDGRRCVRRIAVDYPISCSWGRQLRMFSFVVCFGNSIIDKSEAFCGMMEGLAPAAGLADPPRPTSPSLSSLSSCVKPQPH